MVVVVVVLLACLLASVDHEYIGMTDIHLSGIDICLDSMLPVSSTFQAMNIDAIERG